MNIKKPFLYIKMQNQRIMSFDVGIKNMAYCIFEILDSSSQPFQIIDWNILNLMEKEQPSVFCNCRAIKKKEPSKKSLKKPKKIVNLENFFIDSSVDASSNINPVKICGKVAKYQKNGQYYCEKHAKTQNDHMIPKKQFEISQLKKNKIDDLLKICQEHKIILENSEAEKKIKKQAILEHLENFFKNKCLETIIESKKVTAGETDLIAIGKNMKTLLNQLKDIDLVTNVIIENQISPIANRMKTVQGMLAQYFIMRNTDIKIDFVSSINKLRIFTNKKQTENISDITSSTQNDVKTLEKGQTDKQKYKKHKNDGIFYTNQILEKNKWLYNLKNQLNESKKKDDLADCFLQGIWYLKSNKNINIYV